MSNKKCLDTTLCTVSFWLLVYKKENILKSIKVLCRLYKIGAQIL